MYPSSKAGNWLHAGLRRAQEQEAAMIYTRTVRQAWHDVDDALTAYEREQQRRAELIRAIAPN